MNNFLLYTKYKLKTHSSAHKISKLIYQHSEQHFSNSQEGDLK